MPIALLANPISPFVIVRRTFFFLRNCLSNRELFQDLFKPNSKHYCNYYDMTTTFQFDIVQNTSINGCVADENFLKPIFRWTCQYKLYHLLVNAATTTTKNTGFAKVIVLRISCCIPALVFTFLPKHNPEHHRCR